MFRQRRQLRHWAAWVLFAWLFGVASGVAHACLAPSADGPGGDRVAAPVGEAHGRSALPGHDSHHVSDPAHAGDLDHGGTPGLSTVAITLRNTSACILRTISRDPRIGKFSLVAFNMQDQKILYKQENADRIDFPKIGWGVNAGEERELPDDKEAQAAILAAPEIIPIKNKPRNEDNEK